MNIVLFEEEEIGQRLARDDARVIHVTEVLGRKVGERFDAGVVNGRSGKAALTRIGENAVELEIELDREEPPLPPIDLIVGLSRPQTNRKILREATTLGVRTMHFVTTERGEPSYLSSKLWTTEEWRRHVVAGAAQAFTTRIPSVRYDIGLDEAISLSNLGIKKIGLDNYEGTKHLAELGTGERSVAVAIGSERGWTGSERESLRNANFELAHLGRRPLRTETAVIAGLSILNYGLNT